MQTEKTHVNQSYENLSQDARSIHWIKIIDKRGGLVYAKEKYFPVRMPGGAKNSLEATL